MVGSEAGEGSRERARRPSGPELRPQRPAAGAQETGWESLPGRPGHSGRPGQQQGGLAAQRHLGGLLAPELGAWRFTSRFGGSSYCHCKENYSGGDKDIQHPHKEGDMLQLGTE